MKKPPATTIKQKFRNGEVHDWYRTVWGYSDHLVGSLIDEFAFGADTRVLDPFCGSGTTLVESMKRGLDSTGIDANPASCFASRVKTFWGLRPQRLLDLIVQAESEYRERLLREDHESDRTFQYIVATGMSARGWIGTESLKSAICLKGAIRKLGTSRHYKDALTLALLDTVVRDASNIRFGPELYCGKARTGVDIFARFENRVRKMAADLTIARTNEAGTATVIEGDSRAFDRLRPEIGRKRFSLVICSPPYPAEHDYTRNSRLELAFLESVVNNESLRSIKRRMVRSHTKGIYAGDSDSSWVSTERVLRKIVSEIDSRAIHKTHGFARLYSRVATEYFGGMKRHLISMSPILRDRAVLAYVVGDQASYLQVPVQTAKILAEIAATCGYEALEIRHWRNRCSSTTSKAISENIMILRKRGRRTHA